MLPCSIGRGRNIVNFGEVGGTDDVVASTRCELGNDSAVRSSREGSHNMLHRLSRKIMEGEHSSHDGRYRRGDLWIACVGLAGFAVHIELMGLRVERAAALRHVPGELDGCATGSHLDLLKALVCQPVGYCLDVRVRR